MGSMYSHRPDQIPPETIDSTPRNHEPLLTGTSSGLSTRRRGFLVDLLRPHVRDYASMNLVLDHLGTFCDNALLEVRFNRDHNIGFSADQMFQLTYDRTTNLWPLDERVNPDFREAVRKFDWRAMWNATMEERIRIRHYQTDRDIYGRNRRSGSQRWIINSAAYTDCNDYAFGLDVLQYLEPIATMQAFHSDFSFTLMARDISGEDMHWFSRSFFCHWDQAFQLLKARYPNRYRADARYILNAYVRQGVNVVDVFLKYWYQGSDDRSGDDFGCACERAGRSAILRQWQVEVDNPFSFSGAAPIPLNIRTILARAQNFRSQDTLFNTVAYLAETVERDNMHRELFKMILASVKDWATVTDNEDMVDCMLEAISDNEEILDHTTEHNDSGEGPWTFEHVPRSPLSDRPLHMPPTILPYDLPEELPDVPEDEGVGIQAFEDDELDWEELTVNSTRPSWIHRLVHHLNPFSTPHVSTWELVDVELEACGPPIIPHTVSHTCEAPKDDICVICLGDYIPHVAVQKDSSSIKQGGKADLVQWRRRVAGVRWRPKAEKDHENMRPMQLDSCSHIFHLACLNELLDHAYPKTGVVQCPCCRATICSARPTRVARGRLGRIPLLGRLVLS
ncbi:uncharacterized protein N0V89_007950 [Didymosphaeria variabile]|uniref:RING-type domain-containing protein n=1 Tax=Didymosphaeria variabile TaxID=1932322 RepID=A0A9W8XH77_9PLEO|nr:uncharacterized protein N0V89_007950 [Didymosphaeria variabile]KAJ4349336.1 hypothetical protein N0V89_007950 [Didymosphaeria variabile]